MQLTLDKKVQEENEITALFNGQETAFYATLVTGGQKTIVKFFDEMEYAAAIEEITKYKDHDRIGKILYNPAILDRLRKEIH
jgi:hypothetical protein